MNASVQHYTEGMEKSQENQSVKIRKRQTVDCVIVYIENSREAMDKLLKQIRRINIQTQLKSSGAFKLNFIMHNTE